jgi:uncharacterized protein YdeI (BOF family)
MEKKMKGTAFALTAALMIFIVAIVAIPTVSEEDNSAKKVTLIDDLKKYENTYIKGRVIKILDEDEFRLEDESGKIKVYTGWRNTNMVEVGESITVKGKMDPGLIKEFYATELIRDDGEKTVLTPDE